MSISAPRLRQSRHGVFVFRFLVPPALVPLVGKKELRKSLGTKNSQTAKVIALHLNALIEHALKSLPASAAMDDILKNLKSVSHGKWIARIGNVELRTDGTKEDSNELVRQLTSGPLRDLVEKEMEREGQATIITAPVVGYTGHLPNSPRKIGEIIDEYLLQISAPNSLNGSSSSRRTGSAKTLIDRRTTIREFSTYIESKARTGLSLNSFVHELQVADVQSFLEYYSTRPARKLKRTSKATALESSAHALPEGYQSKAAIENKSLSQSTLAKQSSNIKGLIEYCRNKGAIDHTSGLLAHFFGKDLRKAVTALTKDNRKPQSYEPFEHDELKKLLDPALLFWCSAGKPDYFWAPLLASHMGFRASEIATLKMKSVRELAEQNLYFIQLFEDETKNTNSARKVPIPDRIIEIGFIEYVKFLHERLHAVPKNIRDEYPLFPHVDVAAKTFLDDPGKNISRFFSRYRVMAIFNLDLNTKVFHSFRHMVVSLLSALKVDLKTQMSIVGHVDEDDASFKGGHQWTEGFTAKQLQTNIRYTKEVNGFDTLSPLQHNKLCLDQACSLYDLDYKELKGASDQIMKMLICNDAQGIKWSAGFRKNQQKLTASIPQKLRPDPADVQDFSWR